MASSIAVNMLVLLWPVEKVCLPSHVKALMSGNSPTRTCMRVDICGEACVGSDGGHERRDGKSS